MDKWLCTDPVCGFIGIFIMMLSPVWIAAAIYGSTKGLLAISIHGAKAYKQRKAAIHLRQSLRDI
jgi:hypothetical protein